jgi:flagellar FliJ protein
MARSFPLAGLLRLRRIQEDSAASALALANGRLQRAQAARERARGRVGDLTSTPEDLDALRAIGAARASSSAMLTELSATEAWRSADATEATAALTVARRDSREIEKLERRHISAERTRELHTEQVALDEIASAAWHRGAHD